MAAYGGYVAAQPADISGLVSEFGTKIAAQQQAQKEREQRGALLEQQRAQKINEREEERAYRKEQEVIKGAEEAALSGIKDISDATAATGQQTYESLGTSVTDGTANFVANISNDIKSKKIDPLEGKIAIQTAVRSFKNFADGKKSFADGASFLKEQANDQSELGKAKGAIYFGMGDIPNKTYKIDSKGDIIFYEMDPETKQVVPNSAIPTSAFANYKAYVDKKVDYNKQMNDFAVAARTSFAPSGPLTQNKTISEENNKKYAKEADLYSTQIIPDGEAAARYLTDLGGYGIIAQGKQVKPADENKPSITLAMTPQGLLVADVKPEDITLARKLVREGIDARAKETQQITRNPNIIVNTGGGKENKPTETEQQRDAADRLATAITNDIQSGSINSSNIKNFVLGLASDYDVDPRKSKLIDLGNGTKGIQVIATNGKPNVNFGQNGIITSYDDIISYVPKSQINRVLISDQKKRGTSASTRAPKATSPTDVKIVTLEMVKQKLPEGATKDQINAYVKQLESTGKYKLKKP